MSGEKKGRPQRYMINGERIAFEPRFSGGKTAAKYRRKAEDVLEAVNADDVRISSGVDEDGSYAEVRFSLNETQYEKRVDLFDAQYANMGSIALYLQDWLRHCRRGLLDPLNSLQQFEALPSPDSVEGLDVLDESLSDEELTEAIKESHPDTPGAGDEDRFQRLMKIRRRRKEDE